jgi:5-methylcytosine-specific restriction protein A
MPKPPRLCGLCGRVHTLADLCDHQVAQQRARKARHDAHRPSARDRGYDAEWDKARAAYLNNHPLCRRCGNPATTVDHVVPHRGDRKLFQDRTNWQPLCQRCHNGHKQRAERAAVSL